MQSRANDLHAATSGCSRPLIICMLMSKPAAKDLELYEHSAGFGKLNDTQRAMDTLESRISEAVAA